MTRAVKEVGAMTRTKTRALLQQSDKGGLFEERICEVSEDGREGAFQLPDKGRPSREGLVCATPHLPPTLLPPSHPCPGRKELGMFRE